MWFLKSSIDATPVDAETFAIEILTKKNEIHDLQLTYEKMYYQIEMDNIFLNASFFFDIFSLNLRPKMYTMSFDDIYFKIDLQKSDPQYQYNEKKLIDEKVKKKFEFYSPEKHLSVFMDDIIKHLKDFNIEQSLMKEFNLLTEELYKNQRNIAKSLFAETDESYPQGYIDAYQVVGGMLLNDKYQQATIKKYTSNVRLRYDQLALFSKYPPMVNIMTALEEYFTMKNGNKAKFIEYDLKKQKYILNGDKGSFAFLVQKKCKEKDKGFKWSILNAAFYNEDFYDNYKHYNTKNDTELRKMEKYIHDYWDRTH
jgi:hypothetical protein